MFGVNADPRSVSEEITLLKKDFPKLKIQSATNAFLSASYERTKYTRIKFTLTFPDEYPHHLLIVDVISDEVVPPGLKKKLETDISKNLPKGHYGQIATVVQRLVDFVDNNKFLPCWKELKQCINLIREENDKKETLNKSNENLAKSNGKRSWELKSSISILESTGKIKLRLAGGNYFYSCSIIIDSNYPSTTTHKDWGKACTLSMESTNFPPKIETILTAQAKELVSRMQDGMPSDKALLMSNPIRLPKNFQKDSKEEIKIRLTRDSLKSLKKDTETLSRVRDLRQVDAETVQGNARLKANNAKERKNARRAIHKITDKEISSDMAKDEQEKQWQMEEKARLSGYEFSVYDGSDPKPSLLSLVLFLMHKIQRLPEEKCPICKTLTLPSDPTTLKLLYASSAECISEKQKTERKQARMKRPVRTYCGHWYHYACLNKFMTEPPFGAACPANDCQRRVYHPDWPDDIKQLERSWANQQARLREIEDAAMFF